MISPLEQLGCIGGLCGNLCSNTDDLTLQDGSPGTCFLTLVSSVHGTWSALAVCEWDPSQNSADSQYPLSQPLSIDDSCDVHLPVEPFAGEKSESTMLAMK